MNRLLKEYIQHLVLEALDEGKFEDAVKANPKLAPYLKQYFKGFQPKYLPWIVKQLKRITKPSGTVSFDGADANKDFEDDIWLIYGAIHDFEKLLPKIKEKDINKYTSYEKLSSAIDKAKQPSETELRKAAKTQAKKLFEDETYLIVQPLSKEASMYYGKGTKWCVSAKSNNACGEYQDARFLFLINKQSGDKDAVEIWKDGSFFWVYDAKDNRHESDYLNKKYPEHILDIVNEFGKKVSRRKWIYKPKTSLQEVLRKFDVSTFEKYSDLKGMLLYARYYLPSMGKGSSREAFAYGSNKVLKVALNDKGLSQNTTEASVFADKATSPSIAKVFKQRSVGGEVFWLISEIGRPLTSEKEFSSLMGFDWKTYENVIFYFGKGKAGNDLKSAAQFVRNLFEKNLKHFQSINKQSNVVYYTKRLEDLQRLENSPFVAGIIAAMKNHRLLYADLATVDHYGKNAAGKVILLDAGYTEDVWKQHYSTPSATGSDQGTKQAIPGPAKPKQQQSPQGSDAYLPSADTSAPATAAAKRR